MSSFIVGTMNTETGWETQSVPQALSDHLMYWFASRRNQAKTLENTPSFYYLWQKYGSDQDTFITQAKKELVDYIAELFPNPAVDVTTTSISDAGTKYTLVIAVRVISDGVPYDLARSVLITNQTYKVLDEERLNNA